LPIDHRGLQLLVDEAVLVPVGYGDVVAVITHNPGNFELLSANGLVEEWNPGAKLLNKHFHNFI
jgi:hypothetical protein